METSDITIQILTSIRDEIRATREDLGVRIEATNTGLGALERRQVESDIRLSTELVSLAGVVREVRDALRHNEAWGVASDHERRITALERR